uniref:Putative secreted protein n=1 Tax=Panstrongylus lignarius TaxID=156445 RepID=A0A224XTV0_9HEMI
MVTSLLSLFWLTAPQRIVCWIWNTEVSGSSLGIAGLRFALPTSLYGVCKYWSSSKSVENVVSAYWITSVFYPS